jgi:hypothetical protein
VPEPQCTSRDEHRSELHTSGQYSPRYPTGSFCNHTLLPSTMVHLQLLICMIAPIPYMTIYPNELFACIQRILVNHQFIVCIDSSIHWSPSYLFLFPFVYNAIPSTTFTSIQCIMANSNMCVSLHTNTDTSTDMEVSEKNIPYY